MNVMIIMERKNGTEVQSNHNRSPKPQQSPPPYDHRAMWFIWQEVPIFITVIIQTPPVFTLGLHMFQRSGSLTVRETDPTFSENSYFLSANGALRKYEVTSLSNIISFLSPCLALAS